jgi:hypothetical protein
MPMPKNEILTEKVEKISAPDRHFSRKYVT